MELVKTAKRLKKEKINVDLISFGECEFNQVTLGSVLSDASGRQEPFHSSPGSWHHFKTDSK